MRERLAQQFWTAKLVTEALFKLLEIGHSRKLADDRRDAK